MSFCLEIRSLLAGRMKKLLLCAAFLLAFGGGSLSHAASIMFQEGVNGYSGCADSHVHYGGYSVGLNQNYGDSRDLLFGPETYNAG